MLFAAGACGNGTKKTPAADTAVVETFHADNDIAMTVRSLADAIRVGEPLDSIDYDFTGVLTDGTGRPLYTDLQGLPGEWKVEVVDTASVVIRNMEVGDLVAGDLENYIKSTLGLLPPDMVRDMRTDDRQCGVYALYGWGYIAIDVRRATTPSGLEGSLVTISEMRELPDSLRSLPRPPERLKVNR